MKILKIFLILAGLAIWGGTFAIDFFVTGRARAGVESLARAYCPTCQVTLGPTKFSVLSPNFIQVNDLVLDGAEVHLSVKRVTVHSSLPELLRGDWRTQSVELDGFALKFKEQGQVLTTKSEVEIRNEIEIRGGEISIPIRTERGTTVILPFRIENGRIGIRPSAEPQIFLNFTGSFDSVNPITAEFKSEIGAENLSLRVRMSHRDLNLARSFRSHDRVDLPPRNTGLPDLRPVLLSIDVKERGMVAVAEGGGTMRRNIWSRQDNESVAEFLLRGITAAL